MPQAYSYLDQAAKPGINYYRLRQVDFDGQYEYSEMKTVLIPHEESNLQVYPNPSKGRFHIQLPQNPNEGSKLQLLNSQGQMIWQMISRS